MRLQILCVFNSFLFLSLSFFFCFFLSGGLLFLETPPFCSLLTNRIFKSYYLVLLLLINFLIIINLHAPCHQSLSHSPITVFLECKIIFH